MIYARFRLLWEFYVVTSVVTATTFFILDVQLVRNVTTLRAVAARND